LKTIFLKIVARKARLDEAEYAVIKNLAYEASSNGKAQ